MSSSYTRLRYHLVFSTKGRQPYITSDVELLVYKALHRRADDVGAKIIALNGTTDHVHLVVGIPPTLRVSDFVREIKTASTRSIRKMVPHLHLLFEWQNGYGAFTLESDHLSGIIAYVNNQKEHHAHNTLIEKYERTTED
jgi:putative transposase